MKTYTIGRTPIEVIKAALPHKYSMELNKSDMIALLAILKFTWEYNESPVLSDYALSLRTSILTTIGIEEI